MASIRNGTAALLIAGLALSATPAFADQHDRHDRGRSRNNHYDDHGHGSWNNNHGRGLWNHPVYVHPPRAWVPYRAYPYGWRPYGYRPGWSLNFYFGPPRPAFGVGYGAYPAPAYGYYSIAPGVAYGAVRIVDAPRNAQVFVDGYYAGIVDDYDGVFQHLNLVAGPHRIELQSEGYPPVSFDVRADPGRTITYHANLG